MLDNETAIDGIRYLPRQNGSNSSIKKYRIEVDGVFEEVASGKWKANATWKVVTFDPVKQRKLEFTQQK